MQLTVRYAFIICLSIIAILLLWFYWPFLSGSQCLYFGDHNAFFEPLTTYIGGRLRQGQLPLWNPLMGCGQSQVAISSPGLFYPASILFAFLAYSQAVALAMILHQLLCAAGGFLLVRRFGWDDASAFAAAVIFSLNGYMFGLSTNFTLVFTAAWVPLCVYFLSLIPLADKKASATGVAGGGACIGLLLLGGRPEVWLPAFLFLLIFSSVPLLAQRFSPMAKRASVLSFCTLVAGLLLAMVSLLPLFEWALLSPRTLSAVNWPLNWSASWYDFCTLLFGVPFGNASQASNPFLPLQSETLPHVPLLPSAFFGTIAASVALVALADKTFKWRWVFLAAFALVATMVAGQNLPVFPLLLKVFPAIGILRYPVKLEFFLDALVAILAARGLYFFRLSPDAARRPFIFVGCSWLVIAAAAATMWQMPQQPWFGFHHFLEVSASNAATMAVAQLGKYICLWSLVGLAACALAALMPKLPWKWATVDLASAILLVGICASLMSVSVRVARLGTESDFYRKPSLAADIIQAAHRGPVPPRVVSLTPGEETTLPVAYHVPGRALTYDAIGLFRRQMLQDNAPLDYGIGALFPYEGAVTRPIRILETATLSQNSQSGLTASDLVAARILETTSTNYVVTFIRGKNILLPILNPQFFQLIKAVPGLNMRVYETKNALPFAYFMSRWKAEPSDRTALGWIVNAARDHFDPHQAVMLTAEDGIIDLAAPVASAPNYIVPIVPSSAQPERISLRVHAPVAGAVVVSDNIYPGWSATVDGRPAKLLRANSTFKAVAVQAGWHNVVFAFKPVILAIALLLSGSGGVLLVVLAIVAYRTANDELWANTVFAPTNSRL